MATAAQKNNIARFKAVQLEAKKLKAKNKNLSHIQAVKQAWAILYSTTKKKPIKRAKTAGFEKVIKTDKSTTVLYSKKVKKKAAPKKAAPKKKVSQGVLFGSKKKTVKSQYVKVLGQEVKVGTKLHAKLIAQKKHYDDLNKYESGKVSGTLHLTKQEQRLGQRPITDKDIFKGIQTDKNYFKKQIQENIQLMAKFANAIIYSQNAIKQNINDWEKKEYRKVIKDYKQMIAELKLHNKELFKLIK